MQHNESKHTEEGQNTLQNVQISRDGMSARQPDLNPLVRIFCAKCNFAENIEYNLLWKKGSGKDRFVRWSCKNECCTQKKRSLGNWLRFPVNESKKFANSEISAWCMKYETHKDKERPVHMTLEKFMERDELTGVEEKRKVRV